MSCPWSARLKPCLRPLLQKLDRPPPVPALPCATLGRSTPPPNSRTRPFGAPPPPPPHLAVPFRLTPPLPLFYSPSSPSSPPSSVRPRRLRARGVGGGGEGDGAIRSARDADVEGGGSIRSAAFMPPTGISSPQSLSPTQSSSRAARHTPSPVAYSRHPYGVHSPHSSSPPSPSLADS